jgi:hypothetical protein
MKEKQKIRCISVSKETAYLENQYENAISELILATKLKWPRRSPSTIYKDGLRVAIQEINGLTESIKKDKKNG